MRDSKIIMYTKEDGLTKIETIFEQDTVWLSLDQMAELFQRDKSTISRHIKNIFAEGELKPDSTVAKSAKVQREGSRTVERQIDYISAYEEKTKMANKMGYLMRQKCSSYLLLKFAIYGLGRNLESKCKDSNLSICRFDISGDNQIGSISFTIKDNLITTDDIISKAQNDFVFQKKLYNVLKDEFDNFSVSAKKFSDALEFSSNIGLENIEGLINGEYEINRNEFLEVIRKDNERYISIQGGAGSGKSVLCKKYIENEELVLYARAERFLEENHIDDIWNCCIGDILKYLNGKKLVFFIDSLEFIADCAKTKFELLQYLYAITEDELLLLMKKYPVICKMHKMNSYADLLKSPFYINLIVSNSIDIDNIGDENSLREYIWQNKALETILFQGFYC